MAEWESAMEGLGIKKVLIAGATGFIGSHITEALARRGGCEVFALGSGRSNFCLPAGVTEIKADILDYGRIGCVLSEIKPDTLIDAAWDMSGQGVIKKNNVHVDWLGASVNLLRRFDENGGKRFIHHSSGSEYPAYSGHTEEPRETSRNIFGEVKYAFHQIAAAYCAMNGISFANTVCFNSLGPRIRRNTAAYMAISAFLDRKAFVCKSPYNIWDFTYVGDTAEAVARVLQTGFEGSVNIGRGIPVFVGDMFKKIAGKLNAEHLLTLDYDNTRFEAIVPDVSVLNKEIGFFCETPLDTSLDITIDWIKKEEPSNE